MNALTASPERKTIPAKIELAQPIIGILFKRSAIHPIGSEPKTTKAAEELAMNVIVPSLTPKVSLMSGAKTLIAAVCSSSKPDSSARVKNVAAPPPNRRPFFKLIPSDFTPGRRSSGKIISDFFLTLFVLLRLLLQLLMKRVYFLHFLENLNNLKILFSFFSYLHRVTFFHVTAYEAQWEAFLLI